MIVEHWKKCSAENKNKKFRRKTQKRLGECESESDELKSENISIYLEWVNRYDQFDRQCISETADFMTFSRFEQLQVKFDSKNNITSEVYDDMIYWVIPSFTIGMQFLWKICVSIFGRERN